ncbi:DUF502 domain-containing protein [Piscinibacter sp.]|jgi:uncharacterized membrane protein|uniref:DUF502 domain-containing protein n=1 Tax=Piscinibacter sp. TaxID=1903157 RepID=UPI002F3F4ECB
MLRIFITGLLAALPLAATILIFVWGARLLYGWVGPGSMVGNLLVSIGLGVTGSEVAGYLIGVLIVVLLIFALGLLVQTRLRGFFGDAVNAVMQRIPLVRSVYDMIKKFVGLVSQRDEAGVRSMSPVWLHFGGVGGAAVLGLLSTPEPVLLSGKPYLAVLVPTAPVPIGGGLLYVPIEWITIAEVGVEGLTSIYVSMGVTSHQHLTTASQDTAIAR